MEKLRQFAPWQIIAISLVILAIFMVGAYFAVTQLTTKKTDQAVTPTVASDINGKANQDILKLLDKFEPPRNIVKPSPLRTQDPNSPSTINPFSG